MDSVASVPSANALTRWPGAVSTLAADLVAGPLREACVLGVFPTALYLGLGPAPALAMASPGATSSRVEVLPMLARDALALPTGIRLGLWSREVDWPVRPSDRGIVGEGRVQVRAVVVDGVRTWSPARVTTAPSGSRAIGLDRPGPLRSRDDPLRSRAAGVVRDPGSARGLVGLGSGLTPAGDDALCGVLLALRAAGSERLGLVRDAIGAHLERTTSLSASLLRAAMDGYAVPCVGRLASALAAGDLPAAEAVLPEVLAIGHSSGSDLVAGLLGALDVVRVEVNAPKRSQRYHLHGDEAAALTGAAR